jgi:hypothetical protein
VSSVLCYLGQVRSQGKTGGVGKACAAAGGTVATPRRTRKVAAVIEDLSREDLLSAADQAVEELLAAAGVSAPPVDAAAVAERHLGLTIRRDDKPRRRPSKLDDGVIVLGPGLSVEETQLAVARAIGAYLKPEILRKLGVAPEEQQGLMGVSLAELFGGRLLVPTVWFAPAARELDFDVLELQRRFSTAGHRLIAERLLDLPEPCVITIVDDGVVVRRRSNTWRVKRELSAAEQECQRLVNHDGRPQVVRMDGWTVHGWPVPRPEGTREILRGVADQETS